MRGNLLPQQSLLGPKRGIWCHTAPKRAVVWIWFMPEQVRCCCVPVFLPIYDRAAMCLSWGHSLSKGCKGAKQLKMLVFALHFWLVAFCTWSDFSVLLFCAFHLFVVLPTYTYSHTHTHMHTHWTKSIDSMQVEMKHQGTHQGEI